MYSGFELIQMQRNSAERAAYKRLDETEQRSKLAITRLDRQEDINHSIHERITSGNNYREKTVLELVKRIEALEKKRTTIIGKVHLPKVESFSYHFGRGVRLHPHENGQEVYDCEGKLLLTMPPNKSYWVISVYGDNLKPVFNFRECE